MEGLTGMDDFHPALTSALNGGRKNDDDDDFQK